jgi:glycosyltransferase involved in cell wall biosynthesis
MINVATGTCIIRNGINTGEFKAASNYTTRAARTELGVSHHGPLALYVGRIAVEKDIPLLLRVIDATLEAQPELGWLVVGIEPEKLISVASALGMSVRSDRVSFVPRLLKMSLAYHSSDLLCLTSSHEGSPNCVLEARACGIPVISTNCGDVSEGMLPNDHIVAADPESFVFALNKVLMPAFSPPRECAQVLSIEGSATQWLTVLRSVVHGGPCPPATV